MKVLPFTIPTAKDHSVVVQEDNMPYYYPYLHRHSEAQLIWIKQGEGTLMVDNQMHHFNANDIFYIAPNQPHLFKSNPEYFESNSSKRVESLMVFFNPEGSLKPLFDLPEMGKMKAFLNFAKGGLKLPNIHIANLLNKMQAIQRAQEHQQILLLLEIVDELILLQPASKVLVVNGPGAFSESEGLRVSQIYHFIMLNYQKNITLNEIAEFVHMTPQAFCRYFKKHTRQTFISFLNEIRINEACKKLTSGNYENISIVSYQCGFNSLTNFNRVFKSVKKLAPKSYLKQYYKNLSA